MITKTCGHCHKTVPHNPMKKAGEYRCTYCGSPVNTSVVHGDFNNFIRNASEYVRALWKARIG